MKLRTISTLCALGALLLPVLAACDRSPTADTGSVAAVPNSTALPKTAEKAQPPAKPEPRRAPLVLQGAGLYVPDASPTPSLNFGTPKAAAIATVARVLGGPADELGANDECGGGSLEYATWNDRITIWFEEGRFAGWDDKGGLKTAEGIGIGSSRAALAGLPGLEVEESTLGTEFRAGGLGGVLDSKSPTARVTNLWGGATCVFR